MGKKTIRATEAQAREVGLEPNSGGQYRVSEKIRDKIIEIKLRSGSDKQKNSYKEKKPKESVKKADFVFSAANKGRIMSIDEYCTYYNLPREDIKSYKLVTHTAVPYYNIQFKETILEPTVDLSAFETIISSYVIPEPIKPLYNDNYDFNRLITADCHIGMDDGLKGWTKEIQDNDFEIMAQKTIDYGGRHLIIDDLGDYADGYEGKTTRGGHDLPQNMTTEEAYDQGLNLNIAMIDRFAPHFKTITVNNVCNDNHGGAFGYTIKSAFKKYVELKYDHVKVNNHKEFMFHYIVGGHCFICCHGKDEKEMKFGFKIHADDKIVNKIEAYIRDNGIYQKAHTVEFSKGDSHQALIDLCSSDVFDYCNYPAMSPSSRWVRANFKKGRRGFFNQLFTEDIKNKRFEPFFF